MIKKVLFLFAMLTCILVSCSDDSCSNIETKVKAVDLGLPSGTLWANMNVGASSECDYGSFFAWAEIYPKEQYDWSTYKYVEDKSGNMSKYCLSSLAEKRDFLQTLDLSDDAARQNWGQYWRTPTLDEMNELLSYCSWEWTDSYKHSGKAGYIVKSKVDGYKDRSVFFPAAGYKAGIHDAYTNKGGMYWTSSLDVTGFASLKAAQLYFNDGTEAEDYGTAPCSTMSYDRFIGLSVRPVINEKTEDDYVPIKGDVDGVVQNHEYVDLGLSVKWATCNIGAEIPSAGGSLYSWGETETKSSFSSLDYKYCDLGSAYMKGMLKYNEKDYLTTLQPEDDAAYVNWGDNWRMPTIAEFEELIDFCDWELTIEPGDGLVCSGVSKINGKKIIISVLTGYRNDDGFDSAKEIGYYWTSDRYTKGSFNNCAWGMKFEIRPSILFLFPPESTDCLRSDGCAIRPVLDE